jgi:MFS superfamily sulfate permease-like transporter
MSVAGGQIPWRRWRPKLLDALSTYKRPALISDAIAGLTVGVVALPLAMAFGIASGVTPQAGLYTAIVGGFLVSLLGGSRIQIAGPTGAYVTILRIHGPFLFGMTEKLADVTADLSQFAPIVILRLRNMTAIDASGLHALETLSDRLGKTGRTLLVCGAREQPAAFLHQAEFIRHVGASNIVPNVQEALVRAQGIREQFSGRRDETAHALMGASI